MYSVAAAAAAAGLSKTTVLRAIQAGLISGTKNEINEWQVDAAELQRLYVPVASHPPCFQLRQGEVTAATGNALPTDGAAANRSGRAQAMRSGAWLNDMAQARRLSGLANSDQKTQQDARTRWWRRVTGKQEKTPRALSWITGVLRDQERRTRRVCSTSEFCCKTRPLSRARVGRRLEHRRDRQEPPRSDRGGGADPGGPRRGALAGVRSNRWVRLIIRRLGILLLHA